MLLSLVSVGYYQPSGSEVTGSGVATVESTSSGSQSFNKMKNTSVDEKLATDIAAAIAVQAKMPIAANVTNLAVSLEAQQDMAQTDDSTVAKPQIIQPASDNRSVITYKVKKGDTLESIAKAHKVQPNTIRWANNMSSDHVKPGQTLKILPVDGVAYTVKGGDTVQSIASHYKSTSERIVAYNDLEVNGIKKSAQIIIPGGIVPANERPGYVAPTPSQPVTNPFGGAGAGGIVDNSPFTPSYATSYPWGWCTYYAAAKSGAPGNWGNANTWAYYATRTPGWSVSQRPVPGAIAQRGGGWGGFGHVAIVEQVSADGSQIKYSDMNGIAGFGGVGKSGWTSASSFENYIYK